MVGPNLELILVKNRCLEDVAAGRCLEDVASRTLPRGRCLEDVASRAFLETSYYVPRNLLLHSSEPLITIVIPYYYCNLVLLL